jgi:hypothetical protein
MEKQTKKLNNGQLVILHNLESTKIVMNVGIMVDCRNAYLCQTVGGIKIAIIIDHGNLEHIVQLNPSQFDNIYNEMAEYNCGDFGRFRVLAEALGW